MYTTLNYFIISLSQNLAELHSAESRKPEIFISENLRVLYCVETETDINVHSSFSV